MFEHDLAGQGPRHPRDRRGRGPRRHPPARSPVPLGSGPEPRHPGGVPGPRLPDPLDPLDPARREYLDRYFKEELDSGPMQDAARAQPRVAGELLGQQRAEGVGARASRRTTRTSSCSISRASSAATTRRPTASSTRSSRPAKTPYAALHDIDANKPGGVDQDPREDVRARAQAPRGAPRGRAQEARASSSTRSTRSASSSSSSSASRCRASRPDRDPRDRGS